MSAPSGEVWISWLTHEGGEYRAHTLRVRALDCLEVARTLWMMGASSVYLALVGSHGQSDTDAEWSARRHVTVSGAEVVDRIRGWRVLGRHGVAASSGAEALDAVRAVLDRLAPEVRS